MSGDDQRTFIREVGSVPDPVIGVSTTRRLTSGGPKIEKSYVERGIGHVVVNSPPWVGKKHRAAIRGENSGRRLEKHFVRVDCAGSTRSNQFTVEDIAARRITPEVQLVALDRCGQCGHFGLSAGLGAFFIHVAKGGEGEAGEDGNNHHHDEQFNQGEGGAGQAAQTG